MDTAVVAESACLIKSMGERISLRHATTIKLCPAIDSDSVGSRVLVRPGDLVPHPDSQGRRIESKALNIERVLGG